MSAQHGQSTSGATRRLHRQPPALAWAIPQRLGEVAGYQIACDACREITWQPWDGPVPESGLLDAGYMAQDCPNCGHALVIEVGDDWGWHRTPYPEWLEQRLELETPWA